MNALQPFNKMHELLSNWKSDPENDPDDELFVSQPRVDADYVFNLWGLLNERAVGRIEAAVENGREIVVKGHVSGAFVRLEYDPSADGLDDFGVWSHTVDPDQYDPDAATEYSVKVRVPVED